MLQCCFLANHHPRWHQPDMQLCWRKAIVVDASKGQFQNTFSGSYCKVPRRFVLWVKVVLRCFWSVELRFPRSNLPTACMALQDTKVRSKKQFINTKGNRQYPKKSVLPQALAIVALFDLCFNCFPPLFRTNCEYIVAVPPPRLTNFRVFTACRKSPWADSQTVCTKKKNVSTKRQAV